MAPRNGYNNVQYPSVECHLWDPIELRFQFRDIRDVRHPIGGATWESFLERWDHLTIPEWNFRFRKIHGGISSISSISSATMEVDSRPSPSHFQILVLFGYKTGLFRFESPRVQNGVGCEAPFCPRLRLVLFTMIGSKTSRGVRATNHSTRIRTSQLVYYCICHIYMNLWWVNRFSYLKESQFHSSWNLGSVSIPRFFHFPRCHHSLANHGVGPSEKFTSCHKRQMGLVGELVFSWENRQRSGHFAKVVWSMVA